MNHKNPSVTRIAPLGALRICFVSLLLILLWHSTVQAQTYKKRVLFYGPTLGDPMTGAEVTFINNHATEFEPVDPNNLVAPGKSQVWNEQQWIDATVAAFQAFDVIVFSDTGAGWRAAVDSRAIWGSAINGNVFITSGDPVADATGGGRPEALRVFRQGLRFAALQPGNAHARAGLYVALGHLQPGQVLNGTEVPAEIELLT